MKPVNLCRFFGFFRLRAPTLLLALGVIGLLATAGLVAACPFCDPVSQTLSEEILSMDAVVLAELVEVPKFSDDDEELAKAKFKITTIVKGAALIGKTRIIETIYFGDPKPKQKFLVMGVDPPRLMWLTPLAVSDRAITYMTKLPSLPESGVKRLAFFQDYLEDKDELLARDAYDEFAKSPYKVIQDLKDGLKHGHFIRWIQDPDIPASRRRLYLTLLGVCGSEKDLPLLEKMLRSDDRRFKAGLDALVGCYLTIKGEAGLPLIEDLFLKNKESEYADTYATIMALRFHGNETNVISRERILKSLHHMLERPQLADLVIPDLARWKDWSQVDRLVRLFKEADEKSSWVRVPVVNYLRRCPLPKAKQHIVALEKIDPAAVKRANTFFPFRANEATADAQKDANENADPKEAGSEELAPEKRKDKPGKDTPDKDTTGGLNNEATASNPPTDNDEVKDAKDCSPGDVEKEEPSDVVQPTTVVPPPVPATVDQGVSKSSEVASVSAAQADTELSPARVNPLFVLGVPLLAGIGILVIQWGILRGAGGPVRR